MNFNKSILGSVIAFVFATSCCWLPALIVAIGGGSTLMAVSSGLESYSSVFMLIGLSFLAFGLYQFYSKKSNMDIKEPILLSKITCPECQYEKEEIMPENACQYFYECDNCKKVIKPKNDDCCVYCSYGTVPCPPIQMDENCC